MQYFSSVSVLLSNPEIIEHYLLDLLVDLDRKFQSKTKKSASLLEKQIIQLLVSYHIDKCDLYNGTLYFQLPDSKELASVDLNWPVDLNLDIIARIDRKIYDIEKKFKNPKTNNWTYLLNTKPQIFSLEEVTRLKQLGLIKPFVWNNICNSAHLLYQKNKNLNLTYSQYLFKLSCLLFYRNSQKAKPEAEISFSLASYKDAFSLFTKKEKTLFRNKVRDHHHFQPTLSKVRGTLIESILNESLLYSNPDKTIFYEEESHKLGYDLEIVLKSYKSIKISSKTGNSPKKGFIHLSSSRTQKNPSLKDKVAYINNEMKEVSIITACVQHIDGNRKKYIRLALNPKKLQLSIDSKKWKRTFKNKTWHKYTHTQSNGFSVTISKSKSEQVDFYIPIEWFDVIDSFVI